MNKKSLKIAYPTSNICYSWFWPTSIMSYREAWRVEINFTTSIKTNKTVLRFWFDVNLIRFFLVRKVSRFRGTRKLTGWQLSTGRCQGTFRRQREGWGWVRTGPRWGRAWQKITLRSKTEKQWQWLIKKILSIATITIRTHKIGTHLITRHRVPDL